MRQIIAISTALLLSGLELCATDRAYEQRFSEFLAKGTQGFVSDTSLVDTNNTRPDFGEKPLSFSGFGRAGELGGIKLGMTMSEVVAVWGKPRSLYTHCGIGPRFYYGDSVFLFFREERLVRIVLAAQLVKGLVFDNGLKGTMGSAQVAAVVGSSLVRITEKVGSNGSRLSYVSGALHMDLSFHHVQTTPPSARQAEELACVIVGRGDRITMERPSEQDASRAELNPGRENRGDTPGNSSILPSG